MRRTGPFWSTPEWIQMNAGCSMEQILRTYRKFTYRGSIEISLASTVSIMEEVHILLVTPATAPDTVLHSTGPGPCVFAMSWLDVQDKVRTIL